MIGKTLMVAAMKYARPARPRRANTGKDTFSTVMRFVIEVMVADPLVGAEQAHLVRDSLVHERGERRGADILNHARNDIALAADCASDDGFARTDTARTAATAAPVLVAALGLAADECFRHPANARPFFQDARRQRPTNPVAHIPSGLGRTQAHATIDLKP